MTRDGLFPDLAFADYLADDAFGSSDLTTFRAGPPAMVPWRRQNRDDGTSATIVGSAAHCAILTPDMFAQCYVAKPEGMTFASKDGKAARDMWLSQGLTILTSDEMATVRGVMRAFDAKAAARDALAGALGCEVSVFWKDRDTGLPCKGRPDFYDAGTVYDLKVSVAANKDNDGLLFAALRNGWLHQLAHNRAGLNRAGVYSVKRGRLIVIPPKPPHYVRLLEVRENDLDFLELANEATRREMARCWRKGEWPGTPDEWTPIELPASAAFSDNELDGAEEHYTDA